MKEKTLVILTVGYKSQIDLEGVGPNNEFIIDYSIYSALKYGFNKIVFIITEDTFDLFKNVIGKRIEKHVEVEYVIPKLDDIPNFLKNKIPKDRTKILGTAQALYCARKYLNENFAVISADNFYGDDAFKKLSKLVDEESYGVVGFEIGKTLSTNSPTKRAVMLYENDKVTTAVNAKCEFDGDKVKCYSLDKANEIFYIEKNHCVSMMMNTFSPDVIDIILEKIIKELKVSTTIPMSYEILLPWVLDDEIKKGVNVKIVSAQSEWVGLVSKKNLARLKEHVLEEIANKTYPEKLWD